MSDLKYILPTFLIHLTTSRFNKQNTGNWPLFLHFALIIHTRNVKTLQFS